MIRMKQAFCLLLATLLLLLPPAVLADEAASESADLLFSFDYDLHFSINPEVFPSREKARARGYAELLDMLDFKGRIIWNGATKSIDLTGSIIPSSAPSAAISFHLYGVPSIIYLESPLLGDQTVFFHNDVLMEFAYKVWDNLGIKLQYFALLHPFSTEHAFCGMARAWTKKVKPFEKSGGVSAKSLSYIASSWSKSLEEDHALKYWITDLAAPVPCGDLVWSEFNNLPNSLTKVVAKKQKLTVRVKKNKQTWLNSDNQTLFTHETHENGVDWALTLPATENNYLPSLSFHQQTTDERMDLSVSGSYVLSNKSVIVDSEMIPDNLLTFSLDGASLPTRWPFPGDFSLSSAVSGALLPNFSVSADGTGSAGGGLTLKVAQAFQSGEELVQMLTCTGTLTPSAEKNPVDYTEDRTAQATGLFFMNDVSLQELVRKIFRPCLEGILDFIDIAPVSACQSIMDSFTESGLLDLVLGNKGN